MERWQRIAACSTVALAGALILLPACGGGDGGSAVSPTPTEESRTVTSDDGKLTLKIPPGALGEDDVEITITSVPLEELPEELQEVQGAGDGYRLEPDGLQFNQPVAVRLELDRAELEDQPEDGITTYALVSLTEGGERELLDELRTEATLGEETVVARGELSHFSWITRTKGSLVVSLEKKPRIQLVGATFTAKGQVGNGDLSDTVTMEGPSATFLGFGTVSALGDTLTPPHPNLDPGDSVDGTGSFKCDQPGLGTYTLRGMATSVVEVEDQEPNRTPLTVTVDAVVECVADEPTPTPTPTPAPTPAPTPTTTAEPSAATLSLDCDHRIPNVESDVIVTVSGLQSGQTVSGSVTGTGVIGDGTFSAVANANGTAEARVPINQFGPYNVTVDGLSGSIEVEDCPQG